MIDLRDEPLASESGFATALREWSKHERGGAKVRASQLQKELTLQRVQLDQLLELRLLDEIDADTFASQGTELRGKMAQLSLQLEAADRDRGEPAELALKVFELLQALVDRWLAADYAAKRKLLEIVCSKFKLDGVTLCYESRKPFDVLAEGLLAPSTRGDKTPVELFLAGIRVFDHATMPS